MIPAAHLSLTFCSSPAIAAPDVVICAGAIGAAVEYVGDKIG